MSIYSIFTFTLFILGVFGVGLPRKHVIITLVSLEILLSSISINFITSSVYLDDLLGQLYAL